MHLVLGADFLLLFLYSNFTLINYASELPVGRPATKNYKEVMKLIFMLLHWSPIHFCPHLGHMAITHLSAVMKESKQMIL